jgi:hypothetical protein
MNIVVIVIQIGVANVLDLVLENGADCLIRTVHQVNIVVMENVP